MSRCRTDAEWALSRTPNTRINVLTIGNELELGAAASSADDWTRYADFTQQVIADVHAHTPAFR